MIIVARWPQVRRVRWHLVATGVASIAISAAILYLPAIPPSRSSPAASLKDAYNENLSAFHSFAQTPLMLARAVWVGDWNLGPVPECDLSRFGGRREQPRLRSFTKVNRRLLSMDYTLD